MTALLRGKMPAPSCRRIASEQGDRQAVPGTPCHARSAVRYGHHAVSDAVRIGSGQGHRRPAWAGADCRDGVCPALSCSTGGWPVPGLPHTRRCQRSAQLGVRAPPWQLHRSGRSWRCAAAGCEGECEGIDRGQQPHRYNDSMLPCFHCKGSVASARAAPDRTPGARWRAAAARRGVDNFVCGTAFGMGSFG